MEHPYGTIKRQWGFSYISTKRGIERASADVGLMFTAYNFRRLINIIGIEKLTKYLKVLVFWFLKKLGLDRMKISSFKASAFLSRIIRYFTKPTANQLKFTT